jgi:hypothetical protein
MGDTRSSRVRRASTWAGLLAALSVPCAGGAAADVTTEAVLGTYSNVAPVDSGVQSGTNPSTAAASTSFSFPAYSGSFDASAAVTDELTAHDAHVSAYVSLEGTSAVGTFVNVPVQANAYADFYDTITGVGLAAPAHLRIPFHLTGVVTIDYGLPPGYSLAFAILFERSFCSATTVGGEDLGGCSLAFDSNDQYYLVWNANTHAPVGVDEPGTLDVPLVPGDPTQLRLELHARAQYAAPTQEPGTTLTGIAIGDFSHTGVLGPAVVVDGGGQPIPGVTLLSASGYDYAAGTAPEPDAAAAGILAAGLLLARRRERSRRQWVGWMLRGPVSITRLPSAGGGGRSGGCTPPMRRPPRRRATERPARARC